MHDGALALEAPNIHYRHTETIHKKSIVPIFVEMMDFVSDGEANENDHEGED